MSITRKGQIVTVLYMLIIAVVFTSFVATVNALLNPAIQANVRAREVQGIFRAMDFQIEEDLPADEIEELAKKHLKQVRTERTVYYCGLGYQGRIMALIFPVEGSGFWGPVVGYIGINPDDRTIINLAFTRHTETPGLGARITEQWFTDQFRRMALPEEGETMRLVQEGKPKGPNDLDAITGATGTSGAVANMLNTTCDNIRAVIREREKK
ncbi:FMN-binding protein [Planctomycetota bacterium]